MNIDQQIEEILNEHTSFQGRQMALPRAFFPETIEAIKELIEKAEMRGFKRGMKFTDTVKKVDEILTELRKQP